jgi:hypothetical protein
MLRIAGVHVDRATRNVALSADARLAASGSGEGTVRLWDTSLLLRGVDLSGGVKFKRRV